MGFNREINLMKRKAIIFGIKGIKLTIEERHLIKNTKPWGIILFSRNIKDLLQLRLLINDIKTIIKDKVLIGSNSTILPVKIEQDTNIGTMVMKLKGKKYSIY